MKGGEVCRLVARVEVVEDEQEKLVWVPRVPDYPRNLTNAGRG